ncbi:DMT family transporter, partial [uncultured Bilophila sp.]
QEAAMSPRSTETTGYLYVFAAALLWSMIGPFSKNCIEAGLSPLEVAFWRAALGGACFFFQIARWGGLRLPLRHALLFGVFGLFTISVFYSSLQIAIELSGAATAMVLLYTAPAWVAVFARVLFHESLSGRKLLALLLAMGGTALVCFSGGSLAAAPSALGIAAGLISGLTYAAHFPIYLWWKSRYSTATLYAYMLLGGVLALAPFVDFAPTRSAWVWANLLALGVLSSYVAYLASCRSLQLISPVKAAVIGNIEPVLGTFWVWLLWHENFSPIGWTGSALVISAVFLLTLERK